MRAWFKLIVVVLAVVGCSAYTAVAVRFKPAAERARFRARRQRVGSRITCRLLSFRVSLTGEVPPEPMLYVCNHLTALDPILISSQIPVACAGKAQIAAWPVLGWIAQTHGMLTVNRERKSSTRSFVELVRSKLAQGVSLLVFPEGTTSWGYDVGTFHTGAFEAVAGSGSALPLFLDVTSLNGRISLDGSGRHAVSHNHHSVLAAHILHLGRNQQVTFEVRVGRPIEAAGLNRKELARLSYEAVCALGEARNNPG